ncbi:PI-stichotoxin-Hmg3d isoform X1 [Musca domestica]|uniref:PI-stichotoxin-Hmg3d isoform X1 n=1 Tax=Musca domestica TaxID=7370 RepID=A0A9J7IA10_MUSDO|nr:PI-stichotoxin-Hmg3d isoform X1 [Musca domestica]
MSMRFYYSNAMKLSTSLILLALIQISLCPVFLVWTNQIVENIKRNNQNVTACLEPKTPGLCRGKMLRYAFDNKSGKCISFYYSGCGATQNNFLTYEECRRDCMQQLRY